MHGRRIISDHLFDREVERLGGFEKIDRALLPIIDALSANPYGFRIIQDDWFPLCRYAVTKPFDGLPGFVVTFTIEEDRTVILREIWEKDEY
jgi:hypothetical protein